jgi:filamentous hemagglutinin
MAECLVAPSNLGRNASTPGAVADANFAQTKINKAQTYSPEGQNIYGELAGRPIKTVDDLATALRDKAISPSQVPVDYVVVEGKKVVLNTRTSVALEEAGIPKSQWYGTNRTGQEVPGLPGKTFDELALEQTRRNGLPPTGTPTPPRR